MTEKLQSQYNMLARKVLVAAESGEAAKFKALFKGRQPEDVKAALSDLSQERYNEVLGNVRFTPLIAGAWHGHPEVVDELVKEYQVSVDEIGYITLDGQKREVTALCAAIRQQNLEIAEYLLDVHNADINFCCPLAIACHRGDLNMVRFLIKHGVDVNAKINSDGITALMTACERYSLYVVRILLDAGADPRLEDIDGNSALHRLALKRRMYVLKNGPLPQIIDSLVSAGALMSTNQAGKTPLVAACDSGNVEVARAIMSLPEVRPEEQLTAQVNLKKKLEKDVKTKRNGTADETADDDVKSPRKSSWTQKFANPNELRKMKWSLKKKKNVGSRIEDIQGQDELPSVMEITAT